MKLDEVKGLICQQGVTDELMAEFLKSLRRVPGNWSKCQHCYLLAYELREWDYAGALRLIEYGLANFADCLTSERFCYEKLGQAHQANGAPEEAKRCFAIARELMAAETGRRPDVGTFQVLETELARTGYTWSEELEGLYDQIDPEESLVFGLRKVAFRMAAAEYLISEHSGDEAFMAVSADKMRRLLDDDTPTEGDQVFRRHGVNTHINLSDAEKAFLARIGVL